MMIFGFVIGLVVGGSIVVILVTIGDQKNDDDIGMPGV